jgi:hypothetical protein
MQDVYFFGYGSLVNRRTHIYSNAHPATARGWRRAWRFAPQRDTAFLTVVPDPGCAIEGLIAQVPDNDWRTLDQREAAYDRLPASLCIDHQRDEIENIAIYAIPKQDLNLPDQDHPVLLSYLDVVIQGYLDEFGAEGAARFFATTLGWDAPVLDDRATPRYPRAQSLTDSERMVVDQALDQLGCRRLKDAV